MTVEAAVEADGRLRLRVVELEVDSAGKNAARGAAVTSLDSIEAGRWSRRYLVDGYDSRTALPDVSDPRTPDIVKQRAELQERIQQTEKDRKAAVDVLLDPATRDGLARTEADLAAVDHDLQELAKSNLVYAASPIPPRPIWVLHRGDVEQKKEQSHPAPCRASRSWSQISLWPGSTVPQPGRTTRAAVAPRGRLDRRRPQPTNMAVDRQPRLALPFRPRRRRYAERLRPQRLTADAPGTARLAGGGVPRRRRLVQEAAPDDRP